MLISPPPPSLNLNPSLNQKKIIILFKFDLIVVEKDMLSFSGGREMIYLLFNFESEFDGLDKIIRNSLTS